LAEAIDRYPTCAIVRVGVQNPFVDPVLIDRLVRTAEQNPQPDYVSYCSKDGRPIVLSKLGIFAEWCRTDALRRAIPQLHADSDCNAITRFFFAHPERFQQRLIPIPDELDRNDLRLTIDAQEDIEHAEEIIDALGPECLDWQRIAGLLDHNPRLRERMAALNRADARAS